MSWLAVGSWAVELLLSYSGAGFLYLQRVVARGAKVALAGTAMRDLTESQINSMGYVLLQRGAVADAVTVFEKNVERFPSSVVAQTAEIIPSRGDISNE